MKAYWSSLNEREQWFLGLGIGVSLLYLFYLLVYAPLDHAVQNKTQQLLEKKVTLAWMQQQALPNKTLLVTKKLTNNQLLTAFATQLRTVSFQQSNFKLQQTGNGDIQLSYEQVPFTPFVQWLHAMSEKYAIAIKQLNAERSAAPGMVKLLVIVSARESQKRANQSGPLDQ